MNVLDLRIAVIDDDLRVLGSLVNLGFIWIQSRKLQIRRTISGIRYTLPNELYHHGC